MADATDTTGTGGSGITSTGATNTGATTGAAATTTAQAASTQAAPATTQAAPASLDPLLDGLETVAGQVTTLSLPGLTLDLWLGLGDGSRGTLHLNLSPPSPAQTSGTGPKGGSLADLFGTLRVAIADSATVSETMAVENGYFCVASLARA